MHMRNNEHRTMLNRAFVSDNELMYPDTRDFWSETVFHSRIPNFT